MNDLCDSCGESRDIRYVSPHVGWQCATCYVEEFNQYCDAVMPTSDNFSCTRASEEEVRESWETLPKDYYQLEALVEASSAAAIVDDIQNLISSRAFSGIAPEDVLIKVQEHLNVLRKRHEEGAGR